MRLPSASFVSVSAVLVAVCTSCVRAPPVHPRADELNKECANYIAMGDLTAAETPETTKHLSDATLSRDDIVRAGSGAHVRAHRVQRRGAVALALVSVVNEQLPQVVRTNEVFVHGLRDIVTDHRKAH